MKEKEINIFRIENQKVKISIQIYIYFNYYKFKAKFFKWRKCK